MSSPFVEFKKQLIEKGLESFGLFYGKYEGSVYDNEDPENRARLKVYCPAAYGKNFFNKWALPYGMPLGKGIGFYFIPNKNDNIWVSFKNGNPEFPLWTYGWYAKNIDKNESEPGKFLFFSNKGYKLLFDEINEKIKLFFNDKTELVLNNDTVSLLRDGKQLYFDNNTVKLNFDSSEIKLSKDKLEINVNNVNMMGFFEDLIKYVKDGQMVGTGTSVWSPATLALLEAHILKLKTFMK